MMALHSFQSNLHVYVHVYLYVCVCACVRVHVLTYMCVCACASVCVHVCALKAGGELKSYICLVQIH